MTIWAVNRIHTPWVSHGYEPVAMFSTSERAEAYRARVEAERTPDEIADPERFRFYGYEIEEWTVDELA